MLALRCLLLALLAVSLRAEVERLDEAPAINFNRMVWFVPTGPGTGTWVAGDLHDEYPMMMGYIEPKRLLGPQKIKWKNRFHELTFIGQRDDGTLIIQFPAGLLFLSPQGDDEWEGTYTVAGAISSPMVFRTSPIQREHERAIDEKFRKDAPAQK